MSKEILVSTRCVKRWKEDPGAFLREAFGVEPEGWQVEMLRAMQRGEVVVVSVDEVSAEQRREARRLEEEWRKQVERMGGMDAA